MSDNSNIYWVSMSDQAIVESLGAFIRHHRLGQNKTQAQLAEAAGINRTTLVEMENGRRSNMITFIQVLRALNLLHVMANFRVQKQISPLQLAEIEMAQRKRASRKRKQAPKPESDW